jgi:hypothetical protein
VNGSSFIKEIGRSYLISSFLPAIVFVYLGSVLFRGFIPTELLDLLEASEGIFGSQWVFSLLFSLWVAFGLYSSQNWTLQLYEGYKFKGLLAPIGSILALIQVIKTRRTSPYYFQTVQKKIDKGYSKKRKKRINRIREIALAELQDLEVIRPYDDEEVLPTRLGNVLRASEIYPVERYNLEALVVWPRLYNVLPQEFIHELEEVNNRFMFLIHSSLLIYVLGIMGLFAGGSGYYLNIFAEAFVLIPPNWYLTIGLALLICGYVIYRIAVDAAQDVTMQIRAGFDLYRFDLLRKLNQPIPITLTDEKKQWRKLSEFFIASNRLRFPDDKFEFKYEVETKKAGSKDKREK